MTNTLKLGLQIESFKDLLCQRLNDVKEVCGYTYFDEYAMRVEYLRKYARVLSVEMKDGKARSESIRAFVDLTTGDIYKPATYKAPAKHARGNVLSEQGGMEAVGPDGFVYYMK